MTETKHDNNLGAGVQVDLEHLDQAAEALAGASSRDWRNVDVRNRYRGLALITIGAYLAATETAD
ncbi:hypothetical protein ACFQ05_04405 [Amycolatopsis umgeniensis]|uniref:Putative negative regulator of RcsB-dependent stress response n=1 Tax=Amycolatopsis umgeniensis TaxID=336628 RepID=A0A841B2C4_9PSEU|nr:hypothetical protein [Amycolatopsis umgeniensis]MBB5852508.1 putative negative regulator of RcsB-dependent stress response [Amycolatopsis umgeniensis]